MVTDGVSVETFLFTLAAITVAAKASGHLARRFGQPPVLGELLAGVILGASALNIIPAGGGLHEVIALLAEIGVILLLFEIGLETDLKEMFSVGPAATIVASVGIVLPFALGFLLWYLWQPDLAQGTNGSSVTMVAIFIGATLTATSVGITSRVLTDMGQMGTAEARIVLGAAIVDDVLGLVILAIVSGLVAGASLSLFGIALKFAIAVGFLIGAIVIGRFIMPRVFGYIEQMDVRGILVVAAFAFALALSALASMAGSAMIIGAFAAGVVLSSTNQFDYIADRMKPLVDVFTPIFFLYVGSAVDLSLLNPFAATFDADILMVAGVVSIVAIVGKVLAGYSVGWGKQQLNHLAIGVGMIPRGEVGLIFAHLGLDSGVIGREVFNAVVLIVMVTTFIAPPLLKKIFSRVDPAVAA
ncbi:MAG: cation:proton antiporter [Gemmatimonadota bacterium]